MNYDFSAIEKKWHEYWEKNDTFHTANRWAFSAPQVDFGTMRNT